MALFLEKSIKNTGGVVKMDQVQRIGDDHCSHCLLFPDPDYRLDVEGITGKPLVIHPVKTDMTDEELAEKLAEEIRMSLVIRQEIIKCTHDR